MPHMHMCTALTAAGRTVAMTLTECEEPEEISKVDLGDAGEFAAQETTLETQEGDEMEGDDYTNPWTDKDVTDPNVEMQRESKDKPDPLRRVGTPIVRTGSPIGEVGRKARISIISIASNLSNRFRKSVDLNEEEIAKLVPMSSAIIDSSDSNSEEGMCECVCVCVPY